jgi:hypothetical protein
VQVSKCFAAMARYYVLRTLLQPAVQLLQPWKPMLSFSPETLR